MTGLRSLPNDTLILMSCGAAKIKTDRAVKLLDLYDGPIWRDLRANMGGINDGNIFVLSGKYGFTSVWTHARPYEEKISKAKVDALLERGLYGQERRGKGMPGFSVYQEVVGANKRTYLQAIVYGSGEYRRAFNAIIEWLRGVGALVPGAHVAFTEGSILAQRKQFNEFLREAR